jgi:NAD+ diphosphatase
MPLTDPANIFAGNPLDRASDRRTDADWIAEQLGAAQTCAVALWNGQPLVEMSEIGETRLVYLSGALARGLAGGEERLLFLGLDVDGEAVFAVDLEGPADPAEGALNGRGRFEPLRALAPRLPAEEAGVAATAKAVFEWRRRHRFCSMCGQQSEAVDGGWKRKCPACGTEHFPRTDPVAIMLAVNHDRCLLGRQASFPPGMYSALAGFMEPGESIEEACARELYEEAALRATSVRYHSSQPWPFPSNLMIGLIAQVADGEAIADQAELEAVRWFTRDEARSLMRGELEGLSCPPPLAIAHQLIKAWAFA